MGFIFRRKLQKYVWLSPAAGTQATLAIQSMRPWTQAHTASQADGRNAISSTKAPPSPSFFQKSPPEREVETTSTPSSTMTDQ